MAKKKAKGGKIKGKGRAKSAPRHPQPKRAMSKFHRHSEQTSDVVTPRFSLRDEARWMAKHHTTAFDSSRKLRNMPIAFVSAGLLEGTLEKKKKKKKKQEPSPPAETPSSSPLQLNTRDMANMSIRTPSPSPSVASSSAASSEEVVLFKGRSQVQSAPSNEQRAPANEQRPGPLNEQSASTHLASTNVIHSPDTHANLHAPIALPKDAEDLRSDPSSETNSVNDAIFKKRRGDRPIWAAQKPVEWVSRSKPGIGWIPVADRPDMDAFLRGEVDPRAVAMDDYAQNIVDSGDFVAAATFANRPLDLDDGGYNEWEFNGSQYQSQEEADASIQDDIESLDNWESDQLRDFDGMSTSTEMEGEVVRILRKRTRKSGLQYLAVYQGSITDDARWLPEAFFKSRLERGLIREFEAKLLARPGPLSSSSDEDSASGGGDEGEEEDEDVDEVEGEDGEELDDETLARVLQKQEELGLGSDEVLLYAADEYFQSFSGSQSGADSMRFHRPSKRRQFRARGGGRRAQPTFPSASAMADALSMDPYGAFDIMDTERPSLRPLKKGRRDQFPPELENTEFTEQLRSQWDADRAKKRLKKAEREELRTQGLLGRQGKAPDLSVKYKDGAGFMEIMEEIRSFMTSDMQTLSLPPMEAHKRATVHEVVHRLGLRSKSRGAGANRFIVLSKTRRTIPFNHRMFDALVSQTKFTYRWSGGEKATGQSAPSNYRYKDGDIVGGSAPELGPENRGRALLEKMGWSKGMALGAADNKGILQPIEQVVKTTRAGLQ